jgi:ribosome-associated heat shock protein Hsp15
MERHRVDHWLKLVCLFKHRTDATEACRGGHVKVNGQRVKPAAALREGDLVEFLLGDIYRRVIVSVLPETQASKEAARTMYVDETPPVEKVERSNVAFRDRGSGRPTKRDRREMEKFGGRR